MSSSPITIKKHDITKELLDNHDPISSEDEINPENSYSSEDDNCEDGTELKDNQRIGMVNSKRSIESIQSVRSPTFLVTGRPSYHTNKNITIQEPENSPELLKSSSRTLYPKKREILITLTLVVVLLSILLKWCTQTNTVDDIEEIKIQDIEKQFPHQQKELWSAIVSGVNDTIKYEHPSSFIFIYEDQTSRTMKILLKAVSKYALCQVSQCKLSPIELNTDVLNRQEYNQNKEYGSLITKFKDDLLNTGVMHVENLDTFPQKYAQVFQSFCDEISPLVKKSIFFFTIRVKKFNESSLYDVRDVENILRNNWKHLENDVFEPLFTRISGILLRVYPEK